MAQQERPCDDCGVSVPRTTSRGQIPKRCPRCLSNKRAGQSAAWRERNPQARVRYGQERTQRRRAERGSYTCPVCCDEFTPKRQRSTYCSKSCYLATLGAADFDEARAVLARRVQARATADAAPLCDHCGAEPKRIGETGRPSRFCSTSCMRAWHSRARRHTETRRAGQINYVHKQRAAFYGGSTVGVTGRQWRAIVAFYGDRCAYCGSPDDIERDHVIPVTRGGGHEPGNVVPACRPCNRAKRDLLLHEWRPGLVIERYTSSA